MKIKSIHHVNFKNAKHIIAGVSTRVGGISIGEYESFNLGKNTNDTPFFVAENRIRYANEFGVSVDQMVVGNQCHGNYVQFIYKPGLYDKVDGFITNQEELLLNIGIADCFPVWFADVNKHLIGISHCGWRGVDSKIHLNIIKEFVDSGSKPENIEIIIGPGIRSCHFEVENDVASKFDTKYVKSSEVQGKFMIDLPSVIIDDLVEDGIPEENISDMNECTYCLPEKYFSHRRDKGITGRMFAGIMFRK